MVALVTGVIVGLILMQVKFADAGSAFTHTLNELRYYINCGIVVIICTAALMVVPNKAATLVGFLATIPLQVLFINLVPEMNYFVRAMWVILIALIFVIACSAKGGFRRNLIQYDSPIILRTGLVLALSLIHI